MFLAYCSETNVVFIMIVFYPLLEFVHFLNFHQKNYPETDTHLINNNC